MLCVKCYVLCVTRYVRFVNMCYVLYIVMCYESNVSVMRALTLKPVGIQFTKWQSFLILILAIAALTSVGVTAPRHSKQQAINKPDLRMCVVIFSRSRSRGGLYGSAYSNIVWHFV